VAELPSKRRIESFVKPFRVTDGRKFKLKDVDPRSTAGIRSKDAAKALLEAGVDRLAELQDRLYAQDKWSLLLIFQAMDAAGKDGTIKHVMSGVNPSGCQVFSFKAPSAEELDHDFMWRSLKCLPERGRIGIFNRSYYEEMLVVRVHPELLYAQKLPPPLVTDDIWKERFEASSSSNSSCTCPRTSSASGFSSGCSRRRRTGSSRWPTPRSGTSGPTTSAPTRTSSSTRPAITLRGMWCRPTTSGSRGWWSLAQ
jgi:hypothetical protein